MRRPRPGLDPAGHDVGEQRRLERLRAPGRHGLDHILRPVDQAPGGVEQREGDDQVRDLAGEVAHLAARQRQAPGRDPREGDLGQGAARGPGLKLGRRRPDQLDGRGRDGGGREARLEHDRLAGRQQEDGLVQRARQALLGDGEEAPVRTAQRGPVGAAMHAPIGIGVVDEQQGVAGRGRVERVAHLERQRRSRPRRGGRHGGRAQAAAALGRRARRRLFAARRDRRRRVAATLRQGRVRRRRRGREPRRLAVGGRPAGHQGREAQQEREAGGS